MCQPEGSYSVDDTEVGLLGLLSLCGCNVAQLLVVYLCRRGRVYVVSATECLHHVLVFGQMGHDAQLYLAVVSREEEAARLWDEALPDFLSIIVPDGNVL